LNVAFNCLEDQTFPLIEKKDFECSISQNFLEWFFPTQAVVDLQELIASTRKFDGKYILGDIAKQYGLGDVSGKIWVPSHYELLDELKLSSDLQADIVIEETDHYDKFGTSKMDLITIKQTMLVAYQMDENDAITVIPFHALA